MVSDLTNPHVSHMKNPEERLHTAVFLPFFLPASVETQSPVKNCSKAMPQAGGMSCSAV